MQSLHHLVIAGRILYLGVSNTPSWVVSKANEYARQRGLTQFSVYEGQWSAAERELEREVLPMCIDEGMALAPFAVLGSGYLKTSAQRAAEAKNPDHQKEGRNVPLVDKPQKTVLADALEKISNARGIRITDVALAWARSKAPYIFPILGGRKIEHLKSNIDALGLELTAEEIEEIEQAVPFHFGYPQEFLGGKDGARQPGDVWSMKRLGHFDWVVPPQVSQVWKGRKMMYADSIS